jgi:hypothetical protein
MATPLVGLAAACGIVFGWTHRDRTDLVAYEGVGYALGVVGLGMMSLLLLYSLRKHWRPLQHAGPAPLWLQIHMALGLLGPTAILLHANFRLGSLNSRAALVCMTTVSLSGVVGRFLYTRIHSAFLDRSETVADLHTSGRPALEAARVRALARLRAYQRAFALWHALHLPFCAVLFGAAAVHVVAVHMY